MEQAVNINAATESCGVPLFNKNAGPVINEALLDKYTADPDPSEFDLDLVKEAALKEDVVLQPHQQQVLDRLQGVPRGRLLLMHALGSGKSLTGLSLAEQLGKPYTAVVPASLRNNMRKEIGKFTTGETPSDVVSYTSVAKGAPVDNTGTLIFDEAHRLRNPESKQTINAKQLADQADRVALLTGTPIVNDPSDLATPLSILTRRNITPEEFHKRYVGEREVAPSFFQRLRGITPGTEEYIKNEDELRDMLRGHVDYYAPDNPTVPVNYKDVTVDMGPEQAQLYKAMYNQLPALMRWKLRWNFPLNHDELARLTSFMSGPRQVGLSTMPFMRGNKDPYKAFNQSPKLKKAYELLQEKLKDQRTKALIFSNYIDAGLRPYAAALEKAKIPAGIFYGALSDHERKKLVDDYNNNKIRVALLGPSGAEGLSFKGTQLVQLLDPHWNSVRGRQSAARGLRFDSHWGLPEDLQNVEVQRFIAKLPLSLRQRFMHKLLGRDYSNEQRAADDYLLTMGERKDRTNQQFIDLLKEIGSHHEEKAGASKGWVRHVIENYASTDPPKGIFTRKAKAIADAADTKGVAPKGLQSWQRMVIFHKNRGGSKLPKHQKKELDEAIKILSGRIKQRKEQPKKYHPKTLLKLSASAKGIPDRTEFGDLGQLEKDKLYDWVVQQHQARRAKLHYDVRFGNKDTGLYSWAVRKGLPSPGNKHLAIQQPLHSFGYAGFEGEIPSGYGAGTVKKHDAGEILITNVGDKSISFTTAHKRYPERYILVKPKATGSKNWLLMNTTPTETIPYEKIHYKTVDPEDIDKHLQNLKPGSSVQAKLDGAASLTKLMDKHYDVASYRVSKETGGPIVHTERVFGGRPEADIPKDLKGTVLRGELYGVKNDKSIPPHELGGLLNSSVAKSLRKQKSEGVDIRNMIFDIDRLGKKRITTDVAYPERMKMIQDVLSRVNFPEGKFHLPDEATDQAGAKTLWDKIVAKQHPLTEEGIVIHPPTGKPIKTKIRPDYDVHIKNIFPGLGKYENVGAGGFEYSLKPEGNIVGRVGTGLSDEVRKDMWSNPDAYIGRVARVKAHEQLPSGALRVPAFIALHEDYSSKAASSVIDGLEGTKEALAPSYTGTALQRLLMAKYESDRKNYLKKHQLIRDLMKKHPEDFIIDSREGNIVGITHVPTQFRLHLPYETIPVKLETIKPQTSSVID